MELKDLLKSFRDYGISYTVNGDQKESIRLIGQLRGEVNYLPKDMEEKVLELASQHPITIEDARRYYLMGGDHADILCQLRSANVPESIINLTNKELWEKKNKELWKELKRKIT